MASHLIYKVSSLHRFLPARYSQHLPLQATVPRTPYGVSRAEHGSSTCNFAISKETRQDKTRQAQTDTQNARQSGHRASDLGKTPSWPRSYCLSFTAFSSVIVYFVVVPLLGRRCCMCYFGMAAGQVLLCSCRRESREAALACASAGVAPAVMKIGCKIGWKATTGGM